VNSLASQGLTALAAAACPAGQACLTINKVVAGGPATAADWDFTAQPKRSNGNNTTGGAVTYTLTSGVQQQNVAPTLTTGNGNVIRTYNITEGGVGNAPAPANYSQTAATCDNGDSPASLQIHAGDNVTCTFTNTYAPPPTANITVHAGGVRTGATSVGPLPDGAIFTATPVSGNPAGGPFTCTITNGNGTCDITVPEGFSWNIQETTPPTGYYLNPNLDTGGNSTLASQPYVWKTGTVNGDIDVPGTNANTEYTDQNNMRFSGLLATSINNPTLQPQCGLKIALVLDQSGSMAEDGKQAQLKTSANAAITALTGTPSQLAIYTFGSNTGGSQAISSTLTSTSAAPLHTFVNGLPTSPSGSTNWDSGLNQVPSGFDMVIFLTDGAPTVYGPSGTGNGNNTYFHYVEEGIYSANKMKAAGTRLVAVGIGVSGAADNLRAVSGPTANSDYYLASDSSFGTTLTQLATGNCNNTLSIQKVMQDPAGNVITPNPADTNGWTFNTSISQGTITPPTVTTGIVNGQNGVANINVSIPAGSSPTVTVTEVLHGGYTFQSAQCSVNGNSVSTNVNQGAASASFAGQPNAVLSCLFTNREPQPYGTFSVTKQVTGTGAGLVPANTAFPVNYSYPAGANYPAGSGTLTVHNDGVAVVGPQIPSGAQVTLTEGTRPTIPGGTWGTQVFSPTSPITIGGAGTTAAVTLTNPITLDTAAFSVKKTVTGNGSNLVPTTASFTVNYSYPAGTGYQAGSSTLTVKNDGVVVTSGQIPVGAVVTLSEGAPTAIPGGTWGTPTFSPSSPITIGAKGTTLAVTLTNPITLQTANFSVVKQVTGTGAGLVGSNASFTVNYSYPAGTGFPAGSGTLTVKNDGVVVTSGQIPVGATVTLAEAAPTPIAGGTWGTPTFSPSSPITIGASGSTIAVTLTNPITLDTGSFSVLKQLSGDGAGLVPAGTSFTVNYSYPAGSRYPAGSGTLTVKNDGVAVNGPQVPVGAQVTFTETPPTPIANATWGTPTFSPSSPITIGAKGTTVAVTLTNPITVNSVKVTLVKQWANSATGDTANLTINGGSPVTSTAPTSASTSTSVKVGSSVNVAETLGVTNVAGYTSTLACTNGVAPSAGGTFTMPGSDVTCTITNTAKQSTVTLQKNWQNAVAGDIAALQINGATGATSTATGTNGIDAGNVATTLVNQGSQVNVAEILGAANAGSYDQQLSCTGVTPSANGTFTMPQGNVTCTITNTARTAKVTLIKSWVNSIAGDTTALSINGGTPVTSTSTGGTVVDLVNTATTTVSQGSTVSLAEALGANNKGIYGSTLQCQGATVSGNSFTMPATDVTCTYTNAAVQKTVTLQKTWVNGIQGDTTSLTINGGTPVVSTSNGQAGSWTDPNTATATVSVGSAVNVAEVLGAANKAGYTSSLSCDNSVTPGGNGGFTMPNASVTCTYTNTAKTATVTLQKTWVNGIAGDTTALTINGGNPATSTSGGQAGSWTDPTNVATATVSTGSVVTLAEALGAANKAGYGSSLSCTNGVNPAADGTFTVPASATAITCTYTNIAATATVKLQKTWVDGVDGDSAALTINGGNGATSTSNGQAGSWPDTAHVASAIVSTGSNVTVAEVLGASNKGGYTPSLACDNGVTPNSDGTFTVPANASTITCTYTNTVTAATVNLEKTWVNGIAGDATTLTINGDNAATSTSNGQAGSWIDTTNVASASVKTGSAVTVAEALAAANKAGYGSQLSCDSGVTPDSDGTFTVPADATAVNCVFTNTAKPATVKVHKTWVNGLQGDTAALSINGGNTATSASGGQSGSWTDPTNIATADTTTGATVRVTEALGAGNAAPYASALACDSGVTPNSDGVFTIPKDATTVNCTFTNTAQTGKLTLKKTVDNAHGGSATADQWTLTAGGPNGASVSGATGVSKVTPVGSYALSEAGGQPGYQLSGLACTNNGDPISGVDPANPNVSLGIGDDVVCTFTNTDIPASLTLVKDVEDPDNSGTTKVPADWTLTATPQFQSSQQPVSGNGTGDSAAGGVQNVPVFAGTYLLDEQGPAGFTPEGWVCEGASVQVTGGKTYVTVANAATVSCTVTNDADLPHLTLQKIVDNGTTGGTADATDWTLTADGPTTVTGTGTKPGDPTNPAITNVGVKVGSYDLTETGTPVGYTAGDWQCTGGELDGSTLTVSEGDNVSCTITNTAQPATWTVSKSSDPASGTTVKPGDVITYTLTATHTGGILPPSLTLHDDLSNVLNNATAVGVPVPTSGDATVTGNDLAWTITNFGGPLVLTYKVKVNADAWGVTVANVLTVPPGGTCDGTCTTDNPTPHFTITKSSDPASGTTVPVGSTVTYTLTAHNDSDGVVSGMTATDDLGGVLSAATLNQPLPDGLTVDPGNPDQLIWAIPDIQPGGADATVSYTVTIKPDAFGKDVRNVVTPGDGGDCPVDTPSGRMAPKTEFSAATDPNCSTDNTVQDVDLSIVKSHTPIPGGVQQGVGAPIDYSLTVKNNGADPATNVVVTDNLPTGLTVKSGSIAAPAGWDASTSTATKIVATFAGPLNPGDTVVITFTALVGTLGSSATDVKNTACVAQSETDANPADNCSTDTTTVKQTPPVKPATPGLADTGSDLAPLLGFGGLLLAVGALLTVWVRRRREDGTTE
jgi:uncharacterized repeat protein (TIGR01451 family)/fimbrial isopeptide formation D2 family protein